MTVRLSQRPWNVKLYNLIFNEFESLITQGYKIKDVSQKEDKYYMKLRIDGIVFIINSRYPTKLPSIYLMRLDMNMDDYIYKILDLFITKLNDRFHIDTIYLLGDKLFDLYEDLLRYEDKYKTKYKKYNLNGKSMNTLIILDSLHKKTHKIIDYVSLIYKTYLLKIIFINIGLDMLEIEKFLIS